MVLELGSRVGWTPARKERENGPRTGPRHRGRGSSVLEGQGLWGGMRSTERPTSYCSVIFYAGRVKQ